MALCIAATILDPRALACGYFSRPNTDSWNCQPCVLSPLHRLTGSFSKQIHNETSSVPSDFEVYLIVSSLHVVAQCLLSVFRHASFSLYSVSMRVGDVGWLLNVPATYLCVSRTGLLRLSCHTDIEVADQTFYHPLTEYRHRANQSQH